MTTWIVTTTVRSKDGTKPIVRALGGDTVFIYLEEGQTATWTVKKLKKKETR